MNEATTGIVIFGALALICSIAAHTLQRRFWLAVTLASIVITVLFQVLVFYQLGYLDPFMPIATVITLFISALCACMVGTIFCFFERRIIQTQARKHMMQIQHNKRMQSDAVPATRALRR